MTSGEGSRDAAQPTTSSTPSAPSNWWCRLLQLVVGDTEGLVLHEGVRSRIGAGLQGGELGESLLGHGHKKKQRKAFRAVRKRNNGKCKFVRNS